MFIICESCGKDNHGNKYEHDSFWQLEGLTCVAIKSNRQQSVISKTSKYSIVISGVATGESKGGQLPPALFRPDFQIRANPVINLKGMGWG